MRSLREQGLVTSALAIVGAVTGFASNGSLEEKDRKSAAYSGGAGEVVPDIGAAGPSGRRCAIACPAGNVPGFASIGPARDCESAAHSGDAGKTHWIDVTAMSPPGAEPSAKGRKCAAGPAVIGARLPLDC